MFDHFNIDNHVKLTVLSQREAEWWQLLIPRGLSPIINFWLTIGRFVCRFYRQKSIYNSRVCLMFDCIRFHWLRLKASLKGFHKSFKCMLFINTNTLLCQTTFCEYKYVLYRVSHFSISIYTLTHSYLCQINFCQRLHNFIHKHKHTLVSNNILWI